MSHPEVVPRAEGNLRSTRLMLLAILVLATVLRLIRLGTFPYWHDEVHNLIASEDLYSTVIQGKLISNHPPLPYILAAAWRAIGLGGSEWTMRLLPALAGVLAVWAIFLLGRRLFNARTGLVAALLLAIAPLHVYHSQDLKEYIYLPLVACLIGIFLHRAFETNRLRDWLLYGLMAGVGCYTEIFVGPLLVALNLWAVAQLVSRRDRWRGWLAGNALGALLFLPWLSIMIRKAVGTMIDSETWWVPPPSAAGVFYYFKAIAFGYTAPKWYPLAVAVFAGAFAWGLVSAIRKNRQSAWLLLCWMVIPVALVYLISLFTESIFLIRAMLPYAMAIYLFVAVGVTSISARAPRAAVLLCLTLCAATGLGYHYLRIFPAMDFPHRPGTHPPRDYAGAARYVLDHWENGDVVAHSAAATWLPFFWYGFRDRPQYFCGVGAKFISDIEKGNPRNTDDPALENYWPQEPQRVTADAHRVWFVFAEWERKYLAGNATDLWHWLDAHFTEVDHRSFLGIELVLYERTTDAPVLLRDRDDGATAMERIAGREQPYTKEKLDNALVPSPPDARDGHLTLHFQEEPFGRNGSGKATILLDNRSRKAVQTRVSCFVSDALIPVASLMETDPADEVWHVYNQHNPEAPPPNFELPVASAHFFAQGSASLQGEISLSAGTYETAIFAMGWPGDRQHARARVRIDMGDSNLLPPMSSSQPDEPLWQWIPGSPLRLLTDSVLPIRVVAETLDAPLPNYADLGYIALRRTRDGRREFFARLAMWPGDVALEPFASESWTVDLEQARPRIDVWVWELGEGGKVYHIFAVRPESP
ncbi:MAG: glycosyltransferase family 39 protein [Candidatus Hydrogenedentes bacterium]|nr:glycosyltransferase family 39 protein [Candidatus Hydrogenedentota bacterium]